jgi:colicin import membrane protein
VSAVLQREKYWAGGLAAFVHLLFLLVLIISVSWKHLPDNPVYAELWTDLPARPTVAPPKPAEPPAKPAIAPPARPSPPPVPATPPKVSTPKPDIALEAAKKRAAEKQTEQEEEKRQRLLQEQMKKAEQAKLAQEAKQAKLREAQALAEAEQKKKAQEAARKNLDAMIAAQMSQELNQERQAVQQEAAAAARSKVVDDYVSRIRQKIRGLIRLPAGLKGNPEVVYKVDLLPNGEVLRVTQVRSSRQPAYDQEVERAIWKASPLPLPPEREAAAGFRSGLELRFRPHED